MINERARTGLIKLRFLSWVGSYIHHSSNQLIRRKPFFSAEDNNNSETSNCRKENSRAREREKKDKPVCRLEIIWKEREREREWKWKFRLCPTKQLRPACAVQPLSLCSDMFNWKEEKDRDFKKWAFIKLIRTNHGKSSLLSRFFADSFRRGYRMMFEWQP